MYKCEICDNLATHWSRCSKYEYQGEVIHYEKRLKDEVWMDPIMEKYWDTTVPDGMTIYWYSKFYCPKHLTFNCIEIN